MREALYTAAEMRAAEERYPGYPETIPELMERAGFACAERALERFPFARSFTVVAGGGSNGGDGRVAARALEAAGREVKVVEAKAGETDLGSPDVVVDALFGAGFSGMPRPDAERLIERMNGSGAPVVAVDVPSGVDASTGEVASVAVRAALSVTFHGRKVGHVVGPGRFHAGDVVVADIGLAAAETENALVGRDVLLEVPPKRASDNKYSAGAVLVVGGSPGLSGAVCLSAEAAFRADAGYVTVAVPDSVLLPVELRLLEAVKRACPDDEDGYLSAAAADPILELAERAGAVALGPGIGRAEETRDLVAALLERLSRPTVVDADALYGLQPGSWRSPVVLTPHEGELARLLGEESSWVSAHRLEAVRRGADRFRCVCLLKGADTLVAAPGQGGVLVCDAGPPSLATAGSGDVLTGVVAAFLAKGLEPLTAAAAAAVAHGLAARAVPAQAGLVASDVVARLPSVLSH
jgi:NAD(P)H-hydrate epimerase